VPWDQTPSRVAASLVAIACALSLSSAARARPTSATGSGLGFRGYYPDHAPGWSPDGRQLAFHRGPFEHSSLGLIRRGGTSLRISPGNYSPLWSPDGRRMALMDGRTVWLANGDGTHRVRIGQGWSADWSPDGKVLALTLGRRLWLVNRDGTELRRLPIEVPKCPNCESNEASPSWSPDGRTLVFEHGEREPGSWGGASVWRADLDGQNLRLLAAPGESPRWSPDGSKILFLSFPSHSDPPQVRVMNADGSNNRNLGRGESPSWSPRGSTLAFELPSARKRVYVVRPGRGIISLRGATSLAWAPDGRRIAFERRGSIYVAAVSGKRQRRVAGGIQPSWSPDGRLIAFARKNCGPEQGIHVISPTGRLLRRLTNFCFIVGTTGPDRIRGTVGTDRVLAGPGNDLVFVRDDRRDIVSCAAGIDRVMVDQFDVFAGCERIER
jgi:Tol biopolymer transport system component